MDQLQSSEAESSMIILEKLFYSFEPSYFSVKEYNKDGILFQYHSDKIEDVIPYEYKITKHRDSLPDGSKITVSYNDIDFHILLEIFEKCHCQMT